MNDILMALLELGGIATTEEIAGKLAPVSSLGSHHESKIWCFRIEKVLKDCYQVEKVGANWKLRDK